MVRATRTSWPVPGGRRAAGTLLLADADAGTRKPIASLLTACGYQVHVCTDGFEALRLIGSIQPDLLLLDLRLPSLSGLEVIRRLQSDWSQSPVPTAVLSDLPGANILRQIGRPFVKTVITKQYASFGEVLYAVAELLAEASGSVSAPDDETDAGGLGDEPDDRRCRRQRPRHEHHRTVSVRLDPDHDDDGACSLTIPVQLQNISVGGAGFIADRPVCLIGPIRMYLDTGSNVMQVTGKPMHCTRLAERSYRVGVKFDALAREIGLEAG